MRKPKKMPLEEVKEVVPVATVNAVEGREWAVGMSQRDFEVEFKKRYPYSDVIPDAKEWSTRKEPERRAIDGVKPESYVVGG